MRVSARLRDAGPILVELQIIRSSFDRPSLLRVHQRLKQASATAIENARDGPGTGQAF